MSPCQPRWPGSPGSHIPSCPIGVLHGGRAQLDDSALPVERRKKKKEPIAAINLFRFPLGAESPGTHPIFMYSHTQHLLLPIHPPLHSFIAFVKSDRRMQSISFSGTFNMCPPPSLHFPILSSPSSSSSQGNYREVSIDGKFMSLSRSHMMYEREAGTELKEGDRQ